LLHLGSSSTHVWVKSEVAARASQALSITPFTISSKGSHYLINTIVQKSILSNKIGIYRKHIRNNKVYMCLYETIRCKHKPLHNAFR
ncbi:hypothetical protein BHM03_00027000, partial [Ensete ventricosum]